MVSHGGRICLVLGLILLAGCASQPRQAGKIERISPEALAQLMPPPQPNLTLDEIVVLSKQGVPAEQIIQKIRDTHSSYAMTPSEAVKYHAQGVDAQVLDEIQRIKEQRERDAVADEINKREQQHQEQTAKLKRQRLMQPYYYDPFYDPFFDPYWGWRVRPGVGAGWRYWRR